MRPDNRLSRMLHVLLHMAEARDPMTSEAIAAMFNTNPVVVRRTLAGLREAGHVRAARGQGGGWSLARPLSELTLRDVYEALGAPELFTLGLSRDAPTCLVEQEVNATLAESLRAAERQLLERFGAVTLDRLAQGVTARTTALGQPLP